MRGALLPTPCLHSLRKVKGHSNRLQGEWHLPKRLDSTVVLEGVRTLTARLVRSSLRSSVKDWGEYLSTHSMSWGCSWGASGAPLGPELPSSGGSPSAPPSGETAALFPVPAPAGLSACDAAASPESCSGRTESECHCMKCII